MAEHADSLFPVIWTDRRWPIQVTHSRPVRVGLAAAAVAALYALCLRYATTTTLAFRRSSDEPWLLVHPEAFAVVVAAADVGTPMETTAAGDAVLTMGSCRVAMARLLSTSPQAAVMTRIDIKAIKEGARPVFTFEAAADGLWSLSAEADAHPSDPDALQRICAHLGAFAEAGNDEAVGAVDYLTGAEKLLIAEANATTRALDSADCLHTLFEAAADRAPDHPAVIHGDVVLTYGELDRKANALARTLIAHGTAVGSRVGIIATRSGRFAVAVLATWKAGAAYVPIDPLLPRQRRETLFRIGDVDLLVTEDGYLQEASELAHTWVPLPPLAAMPEAERGELSEVPVTGGDLAYVIFTSGSSGEPKGALLDHAGRVNMIADLNARIGVTPEDRMLVVASPSFDMTVYDIFGLLAAGATAVLPAVGHEYDVEHWADLTVQLGITLWHSVPSAATLLLNMWSERPAGMLRVFLLDGDWIPVEQPDRLRRCFPNARVFSLGGATEVSVVSVHYEVERTDPEWRSIPYGRPLGNQTAYITDRFGRLAAVDQPGELLLGGAGVAWGYHQRAALTAERFVADSFGTVRGARLYRTGDLARLRPGGWIELLGRIDQQVKIGGVRIELGEVQYCLLQHPWIADAAVVPHRTASGVAQSLGAYVIVTQQARELPDDELVASVRGHLEDRLPFAAVPAGIYVVETFPLNQNGKLDRRGLESRVKVSAALSQAAPATAAEDVTARVAEIWREVLGLATVPQPHESFFDLGGTSLGAIQVVGRLNRRLGTDVSVSDLFDADTIARVAEEVYCRIVAADSDGAATAASRPVLRRRMG